MTEVILIAAQSIDGRITRGPAAGNHFTSEADRRWFRKTLADMPAVLMGRRTYEAGRALIHTRIDPRRPRYVFTRNPRAFAHEAVPGLVFTHEEPAILMERLAASGVERVALVGGAQLHTAFLEAGLVSAVWITIEPWIFGQGLLLAPEAPEVPLRLLSHELLSSQTILLKYAVVRS